MALEITNEASSLKSSAQFQLVKKQLVETIMASSAKIKGIKSASNDPSVREAYSKVLQEFIEHRGRDLYYPFLASGLGAGPFVELADGSVKYDMITGIGVHFFGHTHPELVKEMIEGLPSDIMQGNLEPGTEMKELLSALLSRVGKGSRLSHGWLMCSGTMVNEVALKIIRQKKSPATKILAFKDCFAGRSTTMQEITDNPGYRQGQPLYGEVQYLPFYDANVGLEQSLRATLGALKEILQRFPEKFAALMIEIVQGEGGFKYAPREYYVKVFEEVKKAGIAIWADEVQTFGRTGELFAYQKFGLNEFIDVVTIGKMLQACAVLYSPEFNPKPGLVAGTFSGSTAALRTARRILELLDEEKCFGKEGKIEKLSEHFAKTLNQSLAFAL